MNGIPTLVEFREHRHDPIQFLVAKRHPDLLFDPDPDSDFDLEFCLLNLVRFCGILSRMNTFFPHTHPVMQTPAIWHPSPDCRRLGFAVALFRRAFRLRARRCVRRPCG
jgi:hypothetical protein